MTPEEMERYRKETLDSLWGIKPVVAEQPPPTESKESQVILDLVLEDFRTKAAFGIEHYGTMLMSHNGRDPLKDLYQELIDACMYLRQAILERDGQ